MASISISHRRHGQYRDERPRRSSMGDDGSGVDDAGFCTPSCLCSSTPSSSASIRFPIAGAVSSRILAIVTAGVQAAGLALRDWTTSSRTPASGCSAGPLGRALTSDGLLLRGEWAAMLRAVLVASLSARSGWSRPGPSGALAASPLCGQRGMPPPQQADEHRRDTTDKA